MESKKELRLAWLYPDLLELYGDSGNITILSSRCEDVGINLIVDKFTVGDSFDVSEYDMVFLGGGSDREQSIFYHDLISRKEQFAKAIDDGVVVLLICGGYQLFGKYYKDFNGNVLEGLGLLDYYTETAKERTVGYIVTEAEIDGEKIKLAGFENHGGQTYGVPTPLGKVLHGVGNNEKEKIEGVMYNNLIGTYIHGPLLARNPELTDILINRMTVRRGYNVKFPASINNFELKAKRQILKEFEG